MGLAEERSRDQILLAGPGRQDDQQLRRRVSALLVQEHGGDLELDGVRQNIQPGQQPQDHQHHFRFDSVLRL